MSRPASDLVQSGFLQAGANTPDKVALFADDQSYTYAELVERAHSFAAEVQDRDALKVALCLHNSPVVVDVFFGTAMAGGCVCLFDPGWPTSLLRTLMTDHGPDMVVARDETLADVSGELKPDAGFSLQHFENSNQRTPDDHGVRSQPTSETPFLLGFTSGSSGQPKGFIRPHRTWTESFRHSAREYAITSDDCVFAPGPLSHGLSLYAVVEALRCGATAAIQSHFDRAAAVATIQNYDVTVLVLVPTILDVILEAAAESVLADVKRIITAGAKLSPSLRRRAARVFPNAEIIEYYGASELSFVTVAKGSEACPPDSVGRPFSGVEIQIRNERGQTVRAPHVGTVWVKSDMLSTGYVGPTDGSGMRQDGAWATVGDFGHLDSEGYLFLDGREGSAITSAGYTVYPSAIESVLLDHPNVTDAVVLGVPHARWGEVIAAAVTMNEKDAAGSVGLTEYCLTRLEPYACPRAWKLVDHLERTSSGKVNRAALKMLFETLDL